MSKQGTPTYSEVSHFVDFFQYFLAKCTYDHVLKDNIDKNVLPAVQHVLENKQITILSIGPGNGLPDILLLQALDDWASSHQRHINVSYTMVEPSDGFMALLKSNIATTSKELKNLDLYPDFQFCKVEEFFHTTKKTFDLVLLFHCLYYMDIQSVLSTSYGLLSERGSLVIEVESVEPVKVATLFGTLVERLGEKASTWVLRDLIVMYIEQKGWEFCTVVRYYETDFTDCFEKNSINGERLVEFYAHVPNLKERLGNDGWNSLLSSLKECLYQDKELKWWGTLADELMVVTKM